MTMNSPGGKDWRLWALFLLTLLTVVFMARIEVSIAAEKEIQRYKDNNVLWCKNICNVDLFPHQAMWMDQMDRFPMTSVVAAPRVGKTFSVEMHGLKACAVNPWEDYRVFAPSEKQATDSLKYHIDSILSSPVLSAFVETRLGRKQVRASGYAFQNGSNAEVFGQAARLDGVNATIIRGEEFDDLDMDIWKDRILARGMAKNRNGQPTRIRITGVIQGKENLYNLEDDENYHVLPKIDIYDGLALGVIDEAYVKPLRDAYTDDQWLRNCCVRYVESRNFFWSTYLRKMQKSGNKMNLMPVVPVHGGRYESAGTVALSLDMGAQGGSETASKYSLQVVERIGLYKRWLYGEEFEPTINPKTLIDRVLAIWDFFRPVGGHGDAFDANLIANINDALYAEGLIGYNRQKEHAENKSENWKFWTLQPIRFAGSVKHLMFKGLQDSIHQELFFTPLIIKDDPQYDNLAKLVRQLENIRAVQGGAAYLNYEMIKKSVGDDNVDGLAMSCFYLDAGKDSRIIVEGFGSGQKLGGLTADRGVFFS